MTSQKRFQQALNVLDEMEPKSFIGSSNEEVASLVHEITRAQGLEADESSIRKAIEAQQSKGPTSNHQDVLGDGELKWSRPTSLEELEQRRSKHQKSLWRRWMRRCFDSDNFITGYMFLSFISGLVGASLLIHFIGTLFHIGDIGSFFLFMGTLMAIFIFLVFLGAGTEVVLTMPWRSLDEYSPTDKELDEWEQAPRAHAYARACLNSAVPLLLKGDKKILNQYVRQHQEEQEIQDQQENEEARREEIRQRLLSD